MEGRGRGRRMESSSEQSLPIGPYSRSGRTMSVASFLEKTKGRQLTCRPFVCDQFDVPKHTANRS